MARLTGKVAIITGAGSGIGRATARLFAKEGAQVGVADVNAARAEAVTSAINDTGGEAIAIASDVTKGADCERMVAETVKRFGKLDIMYNNAGISPMGLVHEMGEADWRKVIDVCLTGVFLGTRYALPHLMKQGGVVLNTASIAGITGQPGLPHYCAAKHGVIGFTKVVALDYAKYKVRAVCICPGAVVTNIGESMGISVDPATTRQLGAALHPLGRACEPEDIANAALFLVSDEASLISGVALTVDGAWTCGHTFPLPPQQ
jgi:NAD(P)-dependent dehydrogenase (short-subunit alcohol dehydrogenase family)